MNRNKLIDEHNREMTGVESSASDVVAGYRVLPKDGKQNDGLLESLQIKTNENSQNSSLLGVKPTLKQGCARWWMLTMSCFFLLGNYFVMDNPAILETSIE